MTENDGMHPNTELNHQIKVCYYLVKQIVLNFKQKYTSGVKTFKNLGILSLIMNTYKTSIKVLC